jgi:hypothetical protein
MNQLARLLYMNLGGIPNIELAICYDYGREGIPRLGYRSIQYSKLTRLGIRIHVKEGRDRFIFVD